MATGWFAHKGEEFMSRMVRTAAALLIFASLTCGSLGALPFGPRLAPDEGGSGSFLAAVVEWVTSLLAPDRPVRDTPQPPPPTKDGHIADPSGGGGGG
jgi:hypothetical protein